MDINTSSSKEGYQKALSGLAFFKHDTVGVFSITGEDRQDFLQRQTTNDISLLTLDRPLVTVLTSPSARILDVLTLIERGKTLQVITLPGNGSKTLTFLRSRIFFNDRVIVKDEINKLVLIDLLGPGSTELLSRLGINETHKSEYIQDTMIAGSSCRVYVQRDMSIRLLIPAGSFQKLLTELTSIGVTALSPEEFETLRIEKGLPVAGHELTEEYTPLETGLQWAISANKGCYTGQEVIARQITYDKITRQMVGLSLSEVPQAADTIWSHDKNHPIGKITSTALSPRFGSIALGIIKRPYNQPSTEILTGKHINDIQGRVTPLPFRKSS